MPVKFFSNYYGSTRLMHSDALPNQVTSIRCAIPKPTIVQRFMTRAEVGSMTQIQLSDSEFGFLPQGAILQKFKIAGHNIVLSFPNAEPYLTAPYFGETIGRVANRLANGLITELNGKSYQLITNDGGCNHLHGGTHGWGHKLFSGPHPVSRNGRESTQFIYVSPHGEEGYPGTVEVRVWYTAYEEEDADGPKTILEIEYEVEFTGRECDETVVSVTNHSYFNLSNDPTIQGTELALETSRYLQTDARSVPTGVIASLAEVETGKSFRLGAEGPSLDHCFVMEENPMCTQLDTRAQPVRKLLTAYHPSTSIRLEAFSTEPAFQVYTGEGNDVAATESSPAYGPRSGFAIEPGRFVNAINMPEWRGQVLLKQGQIAGSRIVYKAWKV